MFGTLRRAMGYWSERSVRIDLMRKTIVNSLDGAGLFRPDGPLTLAVFWQGDESLGIVKIFAVSEDRRAGSV